VKARHCAIQHNLLRQCEVGIGLRGMDGWEDHGELGPTTEQNVVTGNALFGCATPIQRGDEIAENVIQGNHVIESEAPPDTARETTQE
ncbi:MAG: hypothetical protein ACODAQ_08480, partial [Phycisphaeraceae bacterium]